MSKVVLITGCSTGIGRDLARQLTRSGYTVVATARKVETLNNLPAALKLPLDVTRPEMVRLAVDCVIQRFGRIDVLVNNAGYTLFGAVEELSDEQVHQMFETNVFGVLSLIRAVVPHMRRQGSGRIINVSSIVGKLATPVNGVYSSTKFALEALSDALRLELAPFGIQVVVVEPGGIKTSFAGTAQAKAQTILSNPRSTYQALYQQNQHFVASMRRQEAEPEVVSRVVLQAIAAPRPKARYLAGVAFSGKLVILLRDTVWDIVVRKMYKIQAAA
ncbi:MAG: SDR family oxidoreductase [Chloroflexota bacterium]|nr:MAG: SDR family oxidoreductase [Chloroflexota bacterium]